MRLGSMGEIDSSGLSQIFLAKAGERGRGRFKGDDVEPQKANDRAPFFQEQRRSTGSALIAQLVYIPTSGDLLPVVVPD